MRIDTLSPERWKRVRELLDLYLDAAHPQEREALLNQPDIDTELRLAVLTAAEQFSEADDLLGCTPPPRLGSSASEQQHDGLQPGDLAGAYRIERQIARGGMGAVYLASRADDAFAKNVAIKALPRGVSSHAFELFLRERRILALLDHPNITRILDAGTTSEGVPYVVMEHVDGEPITSASTHLNSLDLFLQVCSAIQHAHSNMVLHCDLKPSNILVTRDGIPRVLDFGLSQYSNATNTKASGHTRAYASPEQLAGEPLTARSDLYSLGVLLREMLGENPANDLRAIIAKATATQPAARYAAVQDLAADIQRYLDKRPVEARNGGVGYRMRRYIRRHRLRLTAATALAIAVALGIAGTISQRRLAERRFEDVRGLSRAVIFHYQQELAKIQGATALRARMAADTVQYLDKIANDATSDAALRLEIALAYRNVAEAEGYLHVPNIGDIKGALASIEKSIAILRTLREPRELAISLERYANILLLAGRNQDARRAAMQSIEASPDPALQSSARRELSASLINLGLTTEAIDAARKSAATAPRGESRVLAYLQLSRAILMGIGPNTESRHFAEAALQEDPQPVSRLASLVSLARHYMYIHSLPASGQAVETAAKAEREAEAAIAADPNDWRLWRFLRQSQSLQGDGLRSIKRQTEALTKYQQAVETSLRMTQHDPDHPEAACNVIATKARYGEVFIQDFRRVPEAERVLTEAVQLADSAQSDSMQCLDSRKMAVLNLARVAEAKGDWAGGLEWRRETIRNAQRYAAKSPGEPLSLVIEAGANFELGLGGMEAAKHGDRANRLAEARRALVRSREIYRVLASMGNPIENQYSGWPQETEQLIAQIDRGNP